MTPDNTYDFDITQANINDAKALHVVSCFFFKCFQMFLPYMGWTNFSRRGEGIDHIKIEVLIRMEENKLLEFLNEW